MFAPRVVGTFGRANLDPVIEEDCRDFGRQFHPDRIVRLCASNHDGELPRWRTNPWLVFEGGAGPGHGKHIVFVSGDEEYRSEEGLPQLAKILAQRHGFKCTVLFSIDPHDGTINPNQHDNTPGIEALRTADLMVILTRFRELPDQQMRYVVDYVESGRPIVGLRTATHAFAPKAGTTFARLRLAEQGMGRRLRPAGAGRDLDQPPRPPRAPEHARDHRPRDEGSPDSARHQRRRHLGSDRRLCRAAADAQRLASRWSSAKSCPECTRTILPWSANRTIR